ncbi:hypothetical protein [Pedobacter nyackensis]|uniref:hypothetical protein n=1 Tax=Pedobacter nyackensis TaxID=475255 RepID=UPI0029313C65|nr:hypothetical protein [Pedobacter nyackensis]
MNIFKSQLFLIVAILIAVVACNSKPTEVKDNQARIMKGLYSYGPELKSFTECEDGNEYWVADSAKTLELAYNNLGFEKPYEPVYIEVECRMIKSDTLSMSADFDSTMVVTKLLKITKEIPDGPCN